MRRNEVPTVRQSPSRDGTAGWACISRLVPANMLCIVQPLIPSSHSPGRLSPGLICSIDPLNPLSSAFAVNNSNEQSAVVRWLHGLKRRKRFVLISLLPAGFGLGYLFYLGCAVGFSVSKFCGGAESGIQGRVRSIIIPLRSHELHLHHWLLSTVATITSAIQGFSLVAPGLFYGVLGGLILQGILCYDDWHRIVKRRVLCTKLKATQ